MTYERCGLDIVLKINRKSNFQLHFFYQTIDRAFLKTLWRFIFLISYFLDSYFHGFGKEPLNAQELMREKTHPVMIHLEEWIFTCQDDFEINALVSIVFKISRECDLTSEGQIHDICENIFQGNGLRLLHRNW